MSEEVKPKRRKATVRLNATLYAIALQELMHGASTRAELSEATGLGAETVMCMVRALHKRRLIYVASWEQDGIGRWSIAAFAFGDKTDAKKPVRLTPVECKRQQRARRRQASVGNLTAGMAA